MGAATASYSCKWCKQPFTARTADHDRGWAKFCSKVCKANEQAKRTGWAGPGSGSRPKAQRITKYPRHDGMSPMKHKACDTCGGAAINGVYRDDGSIEWGCTLHHSTDHPFSSDALGQW